MFKCHVLKWKMLISLSHQKFFLAKRHKNTDSPICQTLSSPDQPALYNNNFATGNGELLNVIADIAQRDGNVFFVLHEH